MSTELWTPRRVAAIIAAVLHRQGPSGVIFPAGLHAVLAQADGASILIDVADSSGPNGQRSFVIEIREV